MLLIALRAAWDGLLAVLPAPLLSRLDGWAREAADRRVERRRRLMARR